MPINQQAKQSILDKSSNDIKDYYNSPMDYDKRTVANLAAKFAVDSLFDEKHVVSLSNFKNRKEVREKNRVLRKRLLDTTLELVKNESKAVMTASTNSGDLSVKQGIILSMITWFVIRSIVWWAVCRVISYIDKEDIFV